MYPVTLAIESTAPAPVVAGGEGGEAGGGGGGGRRGQPT